MPRQSSIDVEAVETKIRDTILKSSVALSRRAIFELCGFDDDDGALRNCFDRYINSDAAQQLIAKLGNRKNRTYIARSLLPKPQRLTPSDTPEEKSSKENSQSGTSRLTSAADPVPTFTAKEVIDWSEVSPALLALGDASGADKIVGMGLDKREP